MKLLPSESQRFVQNLRACLVQQFLGSMPCAASGHHFESFVEQRLWGDLLDRSPEGYAAPDGRLCPHLALDAKQFRKNYPTHARSVGKMLKGRAAMVHLDSAAAHEGDPYSVLLVRQPNGSQQFPDFMLFANGVGLAIEAKSSARDKVVWNGGLPRQDGLYLFNHHGGLGEPVGATLFQGRAVICAENEALLLELHQENLERDRVFNEKIRLAHVARAHELGIPVHDCHPLPVLYYSRAMYNSVATYFANHQLRRAREEAALDFLSIFLDGSVSLHLKAMDAAKGCGKLEVF